MEKDIEVIYKDVIKVLSSIEMVVKDEHQFAIIRRQMLDIANDVKRLKEKDSAN